MDPLSNRDNHQSKLVFLKITHTKKFIYFLKFLGSFKNKELWFHNQLSSHLIKIFFYHLPCKIF